MLDFAGQVLARLPGGDGDVSPDRMPVAMEDKVIAEAAMLLYSAGAVQELDEGLRERVHDLAVRLVPLARSESLLAVLCADPGLASERSVAHAVLSRLGFVDPGVDRLLAETTALGPSFGPEQPPFLRLEQDWRTRVWRVGGQRSEPGLLAQSMLGRQLDLLGATRVDVYAFTHAVMYGSDFGTRRARLPRAAAAIALDAEAALALSLEVNDFDVTCEVTMTWPMLRLPWGAAARFAFGLMADAEDDLGFLPGPTFDRKSYDRCPPLEQFAYAVETSYHTTFVMGILCASALHRGRLPPREIPDVEATGAADAIMAACGGVGQGAWRNAVCLLPRSTRDALSPLLLSASLRTAKENGDIGQVRQLVEAALRHRLVDLPAVRQAADLLRRSVILDAITRHR